jgi:hypothetical protein
MTGGRSYFQKAGSAVVENCSRHPACDCEKSQHEASAAAIIKPTSDTEEEAVDNTCDPCDCLCSNTVTLACGKIVPGVGNACTKHTYSGIGQMPVTKGRVGDIIVQTLRDTGCSGVVVKQEFVTDEQLTGASRYMVRIDNTLIKVPVAKIQVDTPYITGEVEALCLPDALYDLIIGNVPGARAPENPDPNWQVQESGAVMTRGQVQRSTENSHPLKVPSGLDRINVTSDILKQMQNEEQAFKKFKEAKDIHTIKGENTTWYEEKSGILYRLFQNAKLNQEKPVRQVIVPTKLRKQVMRKLLEGMSDLDNYIDDCLVHTATWERHLAVVRELFERIRKAGMTIRPTKCEIGFQNLDFVGHEIGRGEIGLQEGNVRKIQEAPRPETKKQVRSFLGLTGYYREYIPNYSAIAVPLTDLTKKGNPNKVEWGVAHEKAYNTLKQLLTSKPVLKLADLDKPFVLRTDASDVGIGAVLLQEHDGDVFPVAYASKKLLPRERAYSTMEKECLALVWAVKKFEVYVYGQSFTIQTDHQPLVYLNRSKLSNERIMRWAMFLQSYRIRIEAIKGSQNVGADYLSRVN